MKRILKAFTYSWDGFKVAIKEPAFKEELLLFIGVITTLIFLKFSLIWNALIIGAHLLTMIVELLNTAIEATVDLVSPERHPLAKIAKDLGSTAVLFSFLITLTIWCFAFLDCY